MQLDIVTLHHYNDIISTTVGALANILAIYIVRSRTRRELRQYSETLTQNLFIDLLFNAAVFISKVVGFDIDIKICEFSKWKFTMD